MKKFDTRKIGEIAQIKGGKRLPKGRELVITETNHPYIRAQDIREGIITFHDPVYVTEDVFEKIKRYTVKENDVCIVIVGANVGDVGIVPSFLNGANLTENAVKLCDLSTETNPLFMKYALLCDAPQKQMKMIAAGAAQPKLGLYKVKDVEIPFPDVKTQENIASILSTYDDLIENNLRRIKILEEMAQSLYREWFVKFRFPGHQKVKIVDSPLGKIPDGWETKTIGDVCTVIPGYAFKRGDWQKLGVPVIKIKNINSDNTINTEETDCVSEDLLKPTMEKFLLKDGDILIAMTGATAGKIGKLRSRQRMLLNQRVAKIEPHNPYNAFVWCTICIEECQARFFRLADGAAQPNMSGHQIEGFPILLPVKELCQDFSEMVNPFLLEIDNLIHRNRNLRQTRDLLLPKLISGELDVSELDIKTTDESL